MLFRDRVQFLLKTRKEYVAKVAAVFHTTVQI